MAENRRVDAFSDLKAAIAPKVFEGKHSENPVRWLQRFSTWAEARGLSDAERITACKMLCQDRAERWADVCDLDDWEAVKNSFTQYFVRGEGQMIARHAAFSSLRQSATQNSVDFIHTVRDKAHALGKSDIDALQCARNGLKADIRDKLLYSDISSLDQLERICARVDAENVTRANPFGSELQAAITKHSQEQTNAMTSAMEAVCQRMEKMVAQFTAVPVAAAAHTAPERRQSKGKRGACWWCGKNGHRWTECYARARGEPCTNPDGLKRINNVANKAQVAQPTQPVALPASHVGAPQVQWSASCQPPVSLINGSLNH